MSQRSKKIRKRKQIDIAYTLFLPFLLFALRLTTKKLLGDFTLSFTPFGACTFKTKTRKPMSQRACLKGAFHRSLTVLVCYRFPLQYKTNHKYLAFDVSLPPPNYLSCSPKQLDSESSGCSKMNSKECKRGCHTLWR